MLDADNVDGVEASRGGWITDAPLLERLVAERMEREGATAAGNLNSWETGIARTLNTYAVR